MDKKEAVEIINNLISKRNILIDKWDQKVKEHDEHALENITQPYINSPVFPVAADQLQYEALEIIKHEFDNLDFDFMFMIVTNFGWSPNLVYDDNGMFQVSGDSFMKTVFDGSTPEDFPITVATDKNCWFKTPREAFRHFLNS